MQPQGLLLMLMLNIILGLFNKPETIGRKNQVGKVIYRGLKRDQSSSKSFVMLGGPSKKPSVRKSADEKDNRISDEEAQVKEAKSTKRITGGSDF